MPLPHIGVEAKVSVPQATPGNNIDVLLTDVEHPNDMKDCDLTGCGAHVTVLKEVEGLNNKHINFVSYTYLTDAKVTIAVEEANSVMPLPDIEVDAKASFPDVTTGNNMVGLKHELAVTNGKTG